MGVPLVRRSNPDAIQISRGTATTLARGLLLLVYGIIAQSGIELQDRQML